MSNNKGIFALYLHHIPLQLFTQTFEIFDGALVRYPPHQQKSAFLKKIKNTKKKNQHYLDFFHIFDVLDRQTLAFRSNCIYRPAAC